MFILLSGGTIATLLLIFIHSFGLRLRQKLEFSHLQFLSALISQTKSVRKLHNIALLVLRVIIVTTALAAFLLFLFQDKNSSLGTETASSIFVDDTWSMQAPLGTTGGSISAKVKNDAQILSNEELEGTSSERSNSVEFFKDEKHLLAALENTSTKINPVILSDFQKQTFPTDVLKKIASQRSLTLIPYSFPEARNFFIDSVWIENPVVLPGSRTSLKVKIGLVGSEEGQQIKVTALEDDKLIGSSQVLINPSESPVVTFKVESENGKAKTIEIRLEDAVVTFDNSFYVTLPPATTANLKIGGSVDESHPIVKAFKTEPAFNFASIASNENGLLIYQVPTVEVEQDVQELKTWVGKGNSLLLIPNRTNQKLLLKIAASLGLKGVRENVPNDKILKAPDMSDPFFRSIFEKEVRNIKMPEAHQVISWNSAYQTILRFSDNSPFLSSFRIGDGEVYLFSGPVEANSAFAAHPLFVPVVYQIALSQSLVTSPLYYYLNQDALSIPVPKDSNSEKPFSIEGNGQTFIPNQKVTQKQLQIFLPEHVSQPGFYKLLKDKEEVSSFALNIPKEESKLGSYTVDELKDIFAEQRVNINIIEPNERISIQKQVQKEEIGSSLWKYCLILCLLCLLTEAIILSVKRRGSLI